MMNNTAIKLINVSKKYTIHHEKPTLAERLLNGQDEEFWALKKINLEIRSGERVGVIGGNGSGKTTLLKIISGITTPTVGNVLTSGKVISLIDLEAGFHPDLTGIQNIYLNGTILGLNRREIDSIIENIIKFANIGKFIDSPLFTYSSGMALRLGFSIAVHAKPDLLILDESLAVGDENFKSGSTKKINELLKSGTTLVTASHDLSFIKKYCRRAILLDKGVIKLDSSPGKTISLYVGQ